jgi:hypothetical protein
MLKRALHECKEKAALAHQQLERIDAQDAPLFTEPLDALLLRVATRASLVAAAEALERRAAQIECALNAIRDEMRAMQHLARMAAHESEGAPTMPLPDIHPDDD